MKTRYIMASFAVAFVAVICVTMPASAQSLRDTACQRNTDGAIIVTPADADFVTDTNGTAGTSCKEIPDAYRLTFYRLALCAQNPLTNENSLASCTFLVNSEAGVEHVIEGIGNVSILDTATADTPIAPGRYAHIAVILQNEISVRHTEQFSTDIIGATGTGTTCWTRDVRTAFVGLLTPSEDASISLPDAATRSTLGVDCGDASAAAAAYTTEVFDSMGSNNAAFGADSGGGDVRLLQADNATTATSELDAARILVVFPNSAEVTPRSQFGLEFTLRDSVFIELERDAGTQAISALKNGADPFQIALTITN